MRAHFLADHLRDLIKAGEAVPSSSSLLDIISGLPRIIFIPTN
jgi:hypothetical protein